MTKKDLKERMVVETRNGNRYLVCGDLIIRYEGFCNFSDYNENLLSDCSPFDIVKVYEKVTTLEDITDPHLPLLWERKEYHEPQLGDIYLDTDGDKMVIYDIDKYINGDTIYKILIASHYNLSDSSKVEILSVDYDADDIKKFKFVSNEPWYVDGISFLLGNLDNEQI